MTDEAKDRALTNLFNQAAELDRDFHEALDTLRALADDFGPDSQQRWMLRLRETSALRDELWLLEQRIAEMDQE